MAYRITKQAFNKAEELFALEVVRRSEMAWAKNTQGFKSMTHTPVRKFSQQARPKYQPVVRAPSIIAMSEEHLDYFNEITQKLKAKPQVALGLRKYLDQLEQLHPEYVRTLKQKALATPMDFLRMTDMFIAASEAPLEMIAIGNSPSLWRPSTLYNFMPAYVSGPITPGLNNKRWADQGWKDDPNEVALYKQLQKLPPGYQAGSIVFDREWSMASNDAFILGASARGLPMHVTTVDRPIYDIPPDLLFIEGRPTVLARETILASATGYRRYEHGHRSMELVLTRQQDSLWEPRLDAAFEIMPHLKSAEDIVLALKEVSAPKKFSMQIPKRIQELLKKEGF